MQSDIFLKPYTLSFETTTTTTNLVTHDFVLLIPVATEDMQVKGSGLHDSSRSSKREHFRMDTDEKHYITQEDTIVWEEPTDRSLSRLLTLSWNWFWSFCPPMKPSPSNKDSATPASILSTIEESESEKQQVLLTTIDNVVPVIRQPPPVQIQTTWSGPGGHPSIVYIYNLPKPSSNGPRPSIVHLSDRLTSIDTLTVSGDEQDDDSSEDDDDDEDRTGLPPPSPPSHFRPDDLPRPPLHASHTATSTTRPPVVTSRTNTFGSCTTQSSRHRRLRHTLSPADVRSVYDQDYDADDDTLSEASPFPALESGDSSDSSVQVHPSNTIKTRRSSSPPELVHASEATSLQEDEAWMEEWMQSWVSGAPVVGESETRTLPEEISTCSLSHRQVESSYLPRCSWLEHGFLSVGSKIVFAGWIFHQPAGRPIASLPSRHDVVYLMLLENVAKIYMARDDDEQMTTLEVTNTMQVGMVDVSKSHGRGVTISNNGVHISTLIPISLPSFMFQKHSLVPANEFQQLAYRTIAPFHCRSTKNSKTDWNHSSYHEEYAPTAQLEAAMHLMFVMDSWMKNVLRSQS